jgi:carbon storage regulator CsrA
MLVFSRQRDENVILDFSNMTDAELLALRGSTVKITVTDIRGSKVRLGFTAPRTVKIDREEIHTAIQRENRTLQHLHD